MYRLYRFFKPSPVPEASLGRVKSSGVNQSRIKKSSTDRKMLMVNNLKFTGVVIARLISKTGVNISDRR